MSRIIAGTAKGRRLEAPKGQATRPTSDRVREALFAMFSSWLGTVDEDPSLHLEGIRFLDLYSGSGAVGLEAASRGATYVAAVERDQTTARLIAANAKQLSLAVDVKTSSALAVAKEPGRHFDIVFADPPYDLDTEHVDELLAALVDSDQLAPRALVVIERSKRSTAPSWPRVFEETWDRRYGETTLYLGVTADQEDA